jgi:hypothetical protein
VTRLGITGHGGLPGATERLVDAALRQEIAGHAEDGELVGVTAIADGADTLFARAILDAGGSLVVIIPAEQYREGFPAEHHATYDDLLARATRVISLDHIQSNNQAHMDASIRMIQEVDHLLAVWDGQPARGYGGTADVVAAAREQGLPVTMVWPEGAERD